MSSQSVRTTGATIAAALWATGCALGITGTAYHETRLMFWALFVAMIACIASVYLVIDCVVRRERVRLEDLLDGLVAKAAERAADEAMDRIH